MFSLQRLIISQSFALKHARPFRTNALRLFSIKNSETSADAHGSVVHPTIDNKALVHEYQDEIKDLWDTYAARETRKQSMVGVVTSTKCAKSITVTVTRQKLVPKYRKLVNTRKKFMAHDEEERANVGDLVRIVPCRPMSRKKRHRLMDIIKECGQLDFSANTNTSAPLATNSSVSNVNV